MGRAYQQFEAKQRSPSQRIIGYRLPSLTSGRVLCCSCTFSVDSWDCISEIHVNRNTNMKLHYEQVDQHTGTTPKKRAITIPSLESIEEMRTPFDEANSENRTKGIGTQSKLQQLTESQPFERAPFADIN